MLQDEEPFTALGYFTVDKSTYMSIISNMMAYIIILLQF